MQVPRNWPKSLKYAPGLIWSPSVPSHIKTPYFDDLPLRSEVIVRSTGKGKGFGLFAKLPLPEGSFLGPFLGRAVLERDLHSENRSHAIFLCELEEFGKVFVDASFWGNEARFIRSTQEKNRANIFLQHVILNGEIQIFLHTAKAIRKGQELVYWSEPLKVHGSASNLFREFLRCSELDYQHISDAALTALRNRHATLASLAEIRIIKDSNHPCNGERGLFAAKDLDEGIFLGEYTGTVSWDQKTVNYSLYAMDFTHEGSKEGFIKLDADRTGNELRFINDFHGISTSPNTLFRKVWVEQEMKVLSVVTEPIKKGQEFTVDYGEQYWKNIKEAT
eukprot:TRINITY_DN2978_c0_g1_i4.p1 TRINITY_DN2978_c0_g1~~TRINITY_DN2978_c0_g1_i4.p1  ORF type:complete len:334 (-),score=44.30 TRINITY_DN2978_c0_g1_i4:66-1067(-)